MTVLVTGADGQLGRALRPLLPHARFCGRDLDVTDRAAVEAYDWADVTAVVNAAAWTAVDAAEDDELGAWDVNATGVAHLARQARRRELPFVHVSTDYVLRGDHDGEAPVEAPMLPSGVYGITKAAGEMAARLAPQHYVVRTSWVYGDGPNFVRTMRRLATQHRSVTVVDDQVGRPTFAGDLAEALVRLLQERPAAGTYHATGSGPLVSWAGFAETVLAGTGCAVVPISTTQYAATRPEMAPRPASSALAAGPLALRDWRQALEDYLAQECL